MEHDVVATGPSGSRDEPSGWPYGEVRVRDGDVGITMDDSGTEWSGGRDGAAASLAAGSVVPEGR